MADRAAAKARQLIGVIVRDQDLPTDIRRAARRLLPLTLDSPELLSERLESLRQRALPRLTLQQPECGYARCVSVEVFWRFHIAPDVRDFFRHHLHYQAHLESSPIPTLEARAHLPIGVLVPAPHSWLVPFDRIAGLNGMQTRSLLKMSQRPPYLVMIFPMDDMLASGVEVREPRGVDAVPSEFTHWRPGDVPDERIDEDIPLSALGGLEWRP